MTRIPFDEGAQLLGADWQIRSEMDELREHLSLPDGTTAAEVIAFAKLVAQWPSCFEFMAEESRTEIVERAEAEETR